jgi:hypothetical protein
MIRIYGKTGRQSAYGVFVCLGEVGRGTTHMRVLTGLDVPRNLGNPLPEKEARLRFLPPIW